jgi:hypothetical protein
LKVDGLLNSVCIFLYNECFKICAFSIFWRWNVIYSAGCVEILNFVWILWRVSLGVTYRTTITTSSNKTKFSDLELYLENEYVVLGVVKWIC